MDRGEKKMAILKTKIKAGCVEGIPSGTEGVSVFKGVPFAAPPLGNLRWHEPVDHEPWEGVLLCDKFAPACPQEIGPWQKEMSPEGEPVVFDEDCLYLNIWTPAKEPGEKLPVMMWIFGGGAQGGFPQMKTFDGEFLAKRGVILVTINYRVNVFGFFGHPELIKESGHDSCGNYGILDQAFALKWIHENIDAFGGDPDNVTVFGQSCGGRSTIAMSCSPLTKGMINRAIVHSAAGLSLAGGKLTRDDIAKNGEILMERMGIGTLEEMRALPADRLLADYLRITGNYLNSDIRFNICSDGYVMPYDSADSIMGNHYHVKSFILSRTANEGGLMAVEEGDRITKENLKTLGPQIMMDRSLSYILDMYDPETDEEARKAYIDVLTLVMKAAQDDWADLMLERDQPAPYTCCFSRPAPGDRAGAYHGTELWYIFGTLKKDWRPYEKADYDLAEKAADYWANFARTGDPNGPGLPKWTPYTKESPLAMKLDTDECCMVDNEDVYVKKLKEILFEKVKQPEQ